MNANDPVDSSAGVVPRRSGAGRALTLIASMVGWFVLGVLMASLSMIPVACNWWG